MIQVAIDSSPISPNRLLNEHWRSRGHRRKRERKAVQQALSGQRPPVGPWRVTLTRVGAGEVDTDNLAASLKAYRDECAAFLGFDDSRRSPIVWTYRQRKARELAQPRNGKPPPTKFRVWVELLIDTNMLALDDADTE